ncbi:TIGR04372 family glycosyltransferase [Tardiphaga sp. 619_E2_N8_5]|uniref:TIGR04372 family glycosyltransferase n=1 Tax=unclassified Tardiphaga TaxID=2631404 RepID=UPI003F1E7BE6
MTRILPGAGHIRRFLAQRAPAAVAPEAPAPIAADQTTGAAKAARPNLVMRLAFFLYGFLLRHRRRFNRFAGTMSRRATPLTAAIGPKLLRFADAQIAAGHDRLAMAALLAVEVGAVIAIQVHLAASHKVSAVRMARILNALFRNRVRARKGLASSAYFATLSYCGLYDRICAEIRTPEMIENDALNFSVGVAHMYRRHDREACFFLKRATRSGTAQADRKLGCVHILAGRFDDAAKCFASSVAREPNSVMAHQNYAGFYDHAAYQPGTWELDNAGELLIYDNFMQLAESFYHQGRFDDAFDCYRHALRCQARFAERWPLPMALCDRIAASCPAFDPKLPVRLLGYEWVTLVGHFGFLDSYQLMAQLGMIGKANYVLLAPPAKVANATLLKLFEPRFCIIRNMALIDDLLPYQRSIGDQFMAFAAPDGSAEPWPHAAARAHIAATSGANMPLVEMSPEDKARGHQLLREAGIPEGAWIVGIHIREGGFHGDGAGSTRQHRSADIASYLPAVQEITSRGGWVIRLGDKSMSPFPVMPQVFDYAMSEIKSPQMDILLLAAVDLFIGTTSGLTSAAQIFRKPMLLVNCISNDCQYWTDRTSFTVKQAFDLRGGGYLSLRHTYSQPTQGWLIDGEVMQRHGLDVHANGAEDLRAAVAEKLDLMRSSVSPPDRDEWMARYRAALVDNPCMFGAATPSISFLRAHPELLP